MKRAFIITFLIHAALTVLFTRNGLASEGFLEVGFPFIFYKSTNAKMFNPEGLGFSYKAFALNLVFFLIMAGLLYSLMKLADKRIKSPLDPSEMKSSE